MIRYSKHNQQHLGIEINTQVVKALDGDTVHHGQLYDWYLEVTDLNDAIRWCSRFHQSCETNLLL